MEKEPKPFSEDKTKEIMKAQGLEERSKEEQGAFEAGREYEREFQEEEKSRKNQEYRKKIEQQEKEKKEKEASKRREFAKSIGLSEEAETAYTNENMNGLTEEQMLEFIEKLPDHTFLSHLKDFSFDASYARLSEEAILKIFSRCKGEGDIKRINNSREELEEMAENVSEKIRDTGFRCYFGVDLTDGLIGSNHLSFEKLE